MSVKNIIMASVSVRGVYRRFASLTEEEKKEVIEKVKSKLKEKYPESTEESVSVSVPSESTEDKNDGIDVKPVEDSVEQDSDAGGDDDIIDVSELDFGGDTSEGEDSSETEESDEAETESVFDEDEAGGEVEASPEDFLDDDAEPYEEPEIDDFDDEEVFESPEEEEDEHEPIDALTAVPVKPNTPMGEISDDIIEDVEEIRKEGKVDQARVLDLFEDLMQMVTLLIHATPKKLDEARIASRLAESIVAEKILPKSR
jgi:hypothetical protein